MKENKRRGIGSKIKFDDNTKFQGDFLKNSENKDELYQYLASKFIDLHSSDDEVLVVTYNMLTLSTTLNVKAEDMLYCTSEETDQRVIRPECC